jgi:hypothetical protein
MLLLAAVWLLMLYTGRLMRFHGFLRIFILYNRYASGHFYFDRILLLLAFLLLLEA